MKKAAFIDFQGTLGGAGMDDIKSFEFYPFSIAAIRKLNEHGILVIGVTNQSNISRGKLTWDEYLEKLNLLKNELTEHGAYFDAVYCCPHTRMDNCTCKKPLTGMVDEACRAFDIALENSYVIGDMGMNDMVLAKNIGAKGILVLTGVGKGSMNELRHTWKDFEPYYVADTILEAVEKIVDDSTVV